jgi:hypothetical protein
VLAQFESEQKVPVTSVDVDQKGAKVYQEYGKFYPGGGIPYAVILDANDKVIGNVGGYVPYGDLMQIFKEATKGH